MTASDTRLAVEKAAVAFEATSPSDTSTEGRRARVAARLALHTALVADGWEPDELSQRQAQLDAMALRRAKDDASGSTSVLLVPEQSSAR